MSSAMPSLGHGSAASPCGLAESGWVCGDEKEQDAARREAAGADRAVREAEQTAGKAQDQVENVRRKQRRSSQAR